MFVCLCRCAAECPSDAAGHNGTCYHGMQGLGQSRMKDSNDPLDTSMIVVYVVNCTKKEKIRIASKIFIYNPKIQKTDLIDL